MNGENCGNCYYYLANSGNGQGVCRRHPPHLFMMQQGAHPSPLEIGGHKIMSPAQMGFLSQFPPIKTDGWCGEYKGMSA
jgi:hypothetical protein